MCQSSNFGPIEAPALIAEACVRSVAYLGPECLLNCKNLSPLWETLIFESVPVKTSGEMELEEAIFAIQEDLALAVEGKITYSDRRSKKLFRGERVPSRQVQFGSSGESLQELGNAIKTFYGDSSDSEEKIALKRFWLRIVSNHLEPSARKAKRKVEAYNGTWISKEYLKESATDRLRSLFALLFPLFNGHGYTEEYFNELAEADTYPIDEDIDFAFWISAKSVLNKLINEEMCSPEIYEFLRRQFLRA